MVKLGDTLHLRTVEADINHYADTDGRAIVHTADFARSTLQFETRRVRITDSSSARVETDLDREGFVLHPHISRVADFEDKAELEKVHLPELRALLLELTRADRVEFPASLGSMRHSSRSPVARKDDESQPIHYAHIDSSRDGMAAFMDQIFPDRPKNVRRWAYYNFWRVVSAGPLDEPLAVLDAGSLDAEDTIPYDVCFADGWRLESLILRHNPMHRWTYFSQMTRNDVLIFKTYDSDPTKASSVAHTAFVDPSCPPDVPARESYEMRAYACWYE